MPYDSKIFFLFKKALEAGGKNKISQQEILENDTTDLDYKSAIHEDSLTPEILKVDTFDQENFPDEIESFYPLNTRITLVALPFTFGGSDRKVLETEGRWEEFVKTRQFLVIFVSEPDKNNLVRNFNHDTPGYYYDILSPTLKKTVEEGGCSFLFTPGENESPKEFFVQKLNKALENLKRLIG